MRSLFAPAPKQSKARGILNQVAAAVPQLRVALVASDVADNIHGGSSLGRALINPVGFLAGKGRVHGMRIPGDVRKWAERLMSDERSEVEAGLERFTKQLWNSWGNCGHGGNCKPHRDASIEVAKALGLAVAQECLSRGRGNKLRAICEPAQNRLNAAYLASRFTAPVVAPTPAAPIFSPPVAAPIRQVVSALPAVGAALQVVALLRQRGVLV
jgi:hypothetical protein